MNRPPTALLLAARALAIPLASAQPAEAAQPTVPPLPHVRECSEFQVDWYHCYGYLACVEVTWGRLDEGACVENPCPGFQCSWCRLLCDSPEGYVCVDATGDGSCGGHLACAEAWWDPHVWVHQVCVTNECPGLECLACPTGSWCPGPWVGYCSEFFIDWHHCRGQLLCVAAGFGNVQTIPVCVPNPCTPGLAACLAETGARVPAPGRGAAPAAGLAQAPPAPPVALP